MGTPRPILDMRQVMARHLFLAGLGRRRNANRSLSLSGVVCIDVIISLRIKHLGVNLSRNICILKVVPSFALIIMKTRT